MRLQEGEEILGQIDISGLLGQPPEKMPAIVVALLRLLAFITLPLGDLPTPLFLLALEPPLNQQRPCGE